MSHSMASAATISAMNSPLPSSSNLHSYFSSVSSLCIAIFIANNYPQPKYCNTQDQQLLDMRNFFLLTLAALLVSQSLAANGIDIANPTTVSTFTCLKNAGNSFAIVRAFRSTGTLDSNANTNLQNARTAGLATDVYMFPCRGKNATSQVNELISGVTGSLYSTIWIDVETNPSSGCSWSGHDSASNCNFIIETINAIKAKGKTPGIYSSAVMWQGAVGSTSACANAASVPLWYAHYDNLQAFSDFKPFGGWSQPKMKQFAGDVTLCSADIDKNWHP